MVTRNVPMTFAASVSLYNILESILFEAVKDEEGKDTIKERVLPFNVQFKVQKNLSALAKDYAELEALSRGLFEKYGEKSEDGNTIRIKDENKDAFAKERNDMFAQKRENILYPFTFAEIEQINVPGFSVQQMDLFIDALVEVPTQKVEESKSEEASAEVTE